MRLLQLARASCATFTARRKYHRLRLKELEILRLMAMDDCEESEALVNTGVHQLGEVKHAVNSEGLGVFSRISGLFPEIESHSDLESVDDNDLNSGDRVLSVHHISSPTPSASSQASTSDA
ncbi:hypothetical protein J3R83DRAFT_12866 [Lanmaoa asiatica]|nr:hypothetical protein J3R83DRAFT_12866 [Lanmaoa asiatica]